LNFEVELQKEKISLMKKNRKKQWKYQYKKKLKKDIKRLQNEETITREFNRKIDVETVNREKAV
jgi:hypothetical protein